jgi:hypothetical protein
MTTETMSTTNLPESAWRAQTSFNTLTSSTPISSGEVLGELEATAHRRAASTGQATSKTNINPEAEGAKSITLTEPGISNSFGFPATTSWTVPTVSSQHPGNELVTGLKKWVGVILHVEAGLLTAELSPLDHEGPALLADFDLELLAPDDEGVSAGDVIYLTTRYVRGYDHGGRGYNTATTQVRLRRMGQWSQKELTEIECLARRDAAELDDYAE